MKIAQKQVYFKYLTGSRRAYIWQPYLLDKISWKIEQFKRYIDNNLTRMGSKTMRIKTNK